MGDVELREIAGYSLDKSGLEIVGIERPGGMDWTIPPGQFYLIGMQLLLKIDLTKFKILINAIIPWLLISSSLVLAEQAVPTEAELDETVLTETPRQPVPSEIFSGFEKREKRVPHPCDVDGQYKSFYDRTHRFISKSACEPSLWLDNFFGDQADEHYKGGTTLKVTATVSYSESVFGNNSVRYKVRANLPNLSNKLHLIINDETDADDDSLALEAQRPAVASANDQEDEQDQLRAALRWVLESTSKVDVDIDGGLTSSFKSFIQSRYRYKRQLTDISQFRMKQKVEWEDTDGWGESTLLEYNRIIDDRTLFRWSGRFKFTEKTRDDKIGGVWRMSLVWSRQLKSDRAISYVLGSRGLGREKDAHGWDSFDHTLYPPGYFPRNGSITYGTTTWVPFTIAARTSLINGYFTSVRFRQSILRPWIFIEVEPFIDWAIEDGYKTNSGIALRLENWLGNW